MTRRMIHGIASALTVAFVFASTVCSDAADLHLFILSGQSNMAGLKPDISFTPTVEEKFGKENVIVVKDAQGGQPIKEWFKDYVLADGRRPEDTGRLYDRLMEKVTAAVGERKPTTVTFVWMQGERDAREQWQDVYAASLEGLVKQVSDDLEHEGVHVVVGRLSDCRCGQPSWDAIRTIQQEVCEKHENWEWVDTDDLNGPNDGLHYDKEGYATLGERFAAKAIGLIGE